MKRSRKKKVPALTPEFPKALAALADGMADEFKNILTVIFGACSLIDMDPGANDELLKCICLVRVSAEHAADLADNMVFVSGKLARGCRTKRVLKSRNELFAATILKRRT